MQTPCQVISRQRYIFLSSITWCGIQTSLHSACSCGVPPSSITWRHSHALALHSQSRYKTLCVMRIIARLHSLCKKNLETAQKPNTFIFLANQGETFTAQQINCPVKAIHFVSTPPPQSNARNRLLFLHFTCRPDVRYGRISYVCCFGWK
jgi:hypothetical protein